MNKLQKILEDSDLGNHYVIIAGEEAGPKSNKVCGIWDVIHDEAHTLAELFDSGKLETKEETEILVAGPYYGHRGADWHSGLNRITSMEEFHPFNIDGELRRSLESLENSGIKVFTGEKYVGKMRIGYLQFQTSDFGKISSTYLGKVMTLEIGLKMKLMDYLRLIHLNMRVCQKVQNIPITYHFPMQSPSLLGFL
jgi:hypothetical protein